MTSMTRAVQDENDEVEQISPPKLGGDGAPERSEERVGVVPWDKPEEPPAIAHRYRGAQSAALLTQEGSSPGIVTENVN